MSNHEKSWTWNQDTPECKKTSTKKEISHTQNARTWTGHRNRGRRGTILSSCGTDTVQGLLGKRAQLTKYCALSIGVRISGRIGAAKVVQRISAQQIVRSSAAVVHGHIVVAIVMMRITIVDNFSSL